MEKENGDDKVEIDAAKMPLLSAHGIVSDVRAVHGATLTQEKLSSTLSTNERDDGDDDDNGGPDEIT